MREYYEKLLSQGVDRENFMTKYRASCALFVPDPGALDRVIESQVKQKDPKVADLQLVLRSSAVLKVVFSELALKMDFLEYIKRARHALRDLEHNNFDMEEYHNLQRIMQSDAEKLVHAGLRSFDKKQTLVPIFDTFVQVMVHTVYDEFTFRLNARIVSIGVNTGVLPLLPWEQLFYKPGHIEGVSTATKLPAELLEEHMNVRQSVLKALGDRPLTLSQMRREVGWRVKGFLALSRTFSIEWAFLNTFAEMKACDTVRAGILASLPTGSEPLTFKEALSKLDDLRKSDLVFAAGSDVQSDLAGVRSIVAGFCDGVGPTARQATVYSSFYQCCLKKMENFISCEVATKGQQLKLGRGMKVEKTTVFGIVALHALAEQVEATTKQGEPVGLRQLQIFRTFDWVLTPELREKTSKWVQDALRRNMTCPSKAISDKMTHEEEKCTSSSSSIPAGGASASDRLVCVSFGCDDIPIATPPSKKGAQQGVNVMSFFQGRKNK